MNRSASTNLQELTVAKRIEGSYTCVKCGHREHEVGSMHVSGGGFMAIFDIEDMKLTTVTCTQCGFTELYKKSVDDLLKMLADAIIN